MFAFASKLVKLKLTATRIIKINTGKLTGVQSNVSTLLHCSILGVLATQNRDCETGRGARNGAYLSRRC